jgi:hypothetical protein
MGKNKSKRKPKTEFQKLRSLEAKLDNYVNKQKAFMKKEAENNKDNTNEEEIM